MNLRIAALALATVDGMVEANYERARRLGEISLDSKPDIVLLPEAFAAGYCGIDLRPFGEPLDGPHLESFRKLSETGGCMVVLGYLESAPQGIYNAAVAFDRGHVAARHYKSSLWPDDRRPYRDERSLMLAGPGMEVFESRFGRFALLICYENTLASNWDAVSGRADFVLSPYNCEGDPSRYNIENAKRLNLPSAWATRTGTVYQGKRYMPNPGTAGLVDRAGHVIAKSQPGVEEIIVGELPV
ncbi:MAG: carbon-nitrogen hydrolase family protein [Planctomycetes bacterium]|nr:carbon-nitrogen hydrolase family protein [Planctomycetota bacterium]